MHITPTPISQISTSPRSAKSPQTQNAQSSSNLFAAQKQNETSSLLEKRTNKSGHAHPQLTIYIPSKTALPSPADSPRGMSPLHKSPSSPLSASVLGAWSDEAHTPTLHEKVVVDLPQNPNAIVDLKPKLSPNLPISPSHETAATASTPAKKPFFFIRVWRFIYSWIYFQKEAWFKNKFRITAETVTLIVNVSLGVASGALMGFLKGATVGAVVGSIFPGLGNLAGAAAGAVAGLFFGIVCGVAGIIVKPFVTAFIHWYKNRNATNFDRFVMRLNNGIPNKRILNATQKADKLAGMLFNCEVKMLEFIHDEYMSKKASLKRLPKEAYHSMDDSVTDMKKFVNDCFVMEDNITNKLISEIEEEINEKCKKKIGSLKEFAPRPRLHRRGSVANFEREELYNMVLEGQNIGTALAADPVGIMTSQVAFQHVPPAFVGAAIGPIFGLGAALIGSSQSKSAVKVQKILSGKIFSTVNFSIGTVLTVADFVPALGAVCHGIHTFNPLGFITGLGIATIKEQAVIEDDIKIKRKVEDKLEHSLRINESDFELVFNKFARAIRHDVTKNIPLRIFKLSGIAKDLIQKDLKPEKFKQLAHDFYVVKRQIENYMGFIETYFKLIDYTETPSPGPAVV